MKLFRRFATYLLPYTLACFLYSVPVCAQAREGRHDFDFDLGTWKTDTANPDGSLTGSTAWFEMEGTSKNLGWARKSGDVRIERPERSPQVSRLPYVRSPGSSVEHQVCHQQRGHS